MKPSIRIFAIAAMLLSPWSTVAEGKLPLRDGDRIVLVGDGLVERMQHVGAFEAQVRLRRPEIRLVVRNLGWNGDTVTGLSRCYFDPPAEGYKRLVGQVTGQKPTVLVLGYGFSDADAGIAGLARFRHDYLRLIRDIGGGIDRIAILGPMPMQPMPVPFPDPSQRNRVLGKYNEVIRGIAVDRGAVFVDLLALAKTHETKLRGTTLAGFDYDERGYRIIEAALVDLFVGAGVLPVAAADRRFVDFVEAIRFKDGLFFQRYRPQNITYLLGFRKHEQGQNAKDLEELDRVIADREIAIAGAARLLAGIAVKP